MLASNLIAPGLLKSLNCVSKLRPQIMFLSYTKLIVWHVREHDVREHMFAMFGPCSGMFVMFAMFVCNSIAIRHVREHMFADVREHMFARPKSSLCSWII